MKPPAHFNARWSNVWKQALALLEQRGTWRDAQRPLLDEYVTALREAATARELAESDPYHETDKGLLHAHPGFAQADRAARRAVLIANTLGLDKTDGGNADTGFEALDGDELAPRRARRDGA